MGRVTIATRMLWVFGEQRHLMLIVHPWFKLMVWR